MLIARNLSYSHPDGETLFSGIDFSVNVHEKIAIVGNNGVGKSTLLKIIAEQLLLTDGELTINAEPYFVPQIFGQYNNVTVAEALHVDRKIHALHQILAGDTSEENYEKLDNDWAVEERCAEAMAHWQLSDINLSQKMETLSGGQKTKIFLAGIFIHQPEFILLDEPSNHLDSAGRALLYDLIESTKSTLIVVSHDRKLLNRLNKIFELSKNVITVYGGNYDFYVEQKQKEGAALQHDIHAKEKSLKKAKEIERETAERQQKLDKRGKAKKEKEGVAKIMMNTLRNNAEKSTSKLKNAHAEKTSGLSDELKSLRASLPETDKMKFGFDHSLLHKGKILIRCEQMNFTYNAQLLWKQHLDIEIASGERMLIKGENGSGKTTLIKIILGKLKPAIGSAFRATNNAVYIDQDYSLIDLSLNVYEQAQRFNDAALHEHEVRIMLTRFLFSKQDWETPCSELSGGERMRLMLCCLTIGRRAPDMIVLDEPTNNLDIQNIKILTAAINDYEGTLIVISHDEKFVEDIDVNIILEI